MSKRKDLSMQQTNKLSGDASTDALSKMDESLKRRDEINARIAAIKGQYDKTYSRQAELNQTLIQHNFRLQDLSPHKIPMLGSAQQEGRYINEAKQNIAAEIDAARQELSQANADCEKLTEELKQLEIIELPACMVALSEQDVFEHHQRIKKAAGVVASIQAAIDSQNQIIAETKAAIPKAVSRQQERNNILADIALGSACEDDLNEIDAAIANDKAIVAEAEKQAAPLIDVAQETVSGLARKLAAANEALSLLESKSVEVARRYFMGQAEIAAAQYVHHALSLKALHIKLFGLNLSLKKRGGKDVVGYSSGNIHIPKFNLPQFDGLECLPSNEPGVILNGAFLQYGDYFQQAANKEEAMFDAVLQGQEAVR